MYTGKRVHARRCLVGRNREEETEMNHEGKQVESASVNTVRLQELALSYWQSAAFMSAVDLDVFSAVDGGATTLEAIAAATGISETNAERLVTVLLAIGLLEADGQQGGFANAVDVDRFLVKDKPSYAGPWMLFTRPAWDEWGKLTDHLRSHKESVLGMYEDLSIDGARAYHEATYSIGAGAGRRFARHVDLSNCRRLLDIGGGSGAYSIVAAQNHAQLEAIVFDLAPVAEIAREFIASANVADRVTTMAGDFTRDPFPSDIDVAIMASNLPQYSREVIAQVVSRTFDVLAPGGQMHLIGETLHNDRSGPISPALWGLAETLSSSSGVAHSEAECISYFNEAGFIDVSVNPFVEGTLTRITGTRPSP
jgi:predicted nicotinamide N-methyase